MPEHISNLKLKKKKKTPSETLSQKAFQLKIRKY